MAKQKRKTNSNEPVHERQGLAKEI